MKIHPRRELFGVRLSSRGRALVFNIEAAAVLAAGLAVTVLGLGLGWLLFVCIAA